ncbi:ankyrin repeat and SOCS box protein 7-like [Saccoglossus kowalevskii]|uniref:Ankyrin repeat and SOCS box protein 7-like n=1 Tax=Saccoglossus kowalevskii TaxID=10224 RepID=A0ABM0GLT7_SACKO|nr:PREDICTED: ankyrin repeat and SOCS box protein 7-like [Saccoglossus kowalevskii]
MKTRSKLKRTDFSKTARIRLAVAKGDIFAVRRCLVEGTTPNDQDLNGWTLLHLASSRGREKVLRVLLENGGRTELRDSIGGFTALHYAAMHGRTRIARLLLDFDQQINSAVNICSSDGWTPLHVAAHYGRDSFADLLLQHQARVDSLSDKGTTPLQLAMIRERTACIKTLLQWKANIDVQLGFPLRYAVIKSNHSICKLLLKKGADVNLGRQEDGQTPLHLSALKDDVAACQLLHMYGANPTVRNHDGQTPLQISKALSLVKRPCLQFLVEITGSPRSLQDMCRLVIRHAIGPNRLDRIHYLPLSHIMINYLRFKFGE